MNGTYACLLALADTDPLGVNMNVTFNEVGGLDDCECNIYVTWKWLNIAHRYSFVEGNDPSPLALSRSLPTFQYYPTPRCLVPRTSRHWKNVDG